ncbi:transglycosylase SLT domain-containing protein [Streptomyces alfalfae]|uniref:transglycosylase SLT domain-containing protein n=1 Tax=Streptomyces alfalfae TaxID=1642299 RepID=UPI001BAA1CF1|nr:transglycosylase SLT domain-containing protein [Streptomyces alfalfae]QUI30685.1 transglycosylase SLT domain-containing protein [Streptomyces alfalfae]
MAETGRGAVKVGSGYVEINPRLSEEAVRKFREEMNREMKKAGTEAGKTFTTATTEGLKGIEKAVRRAAKKAGEAAEAEAKDSAETIRKIEANLTKQYGEEAVRRFREMRKVEEKKRALVKETSKETQAALKETTRQETQAHTARAKAQQESVKKKQKAQADFEKYVRESNARIARAETKDIADSAKQVERAEREKAQAQGRYEAYVKASNARIAQAEAKDIAAATKAVQAAERDKRRAREDSALVDREIEATRVRLVREAEQRMREEVRRTTAFRRGELQQQIRDSLVAQTQLRRQIQDYQTQVNTSERNTTSALTRFQTGWKKVGSNIETLGTNAVEAGGLISRNLLAPLTLVSGALTTIGIKSADMRILGQKGLTAAGVDKKTAASEMGRVQQYAIDTPFSVDVMHEYQMKLIRSLAAADPDWYKKGTKTKAANQAAGKTSDLIMAVGDSMARAGNLDPAMFQRAMYALDRMSDSDKASTRNINQLVAATGIPAPELAQMFGFNNAGEFWKVVGTPITKGGGVSGTDMMNNLLKYWDPNYFKKGKDGQPLKDKNGQPIVNDDPHSSKGGSKGYGETMTSATITGRIQQMQEGAVNRLGAMFAEPDKNGEYKYTALGEAFMGKGGVLDEVGDIGKSALRQLPDVLMAFATEVKRITGWIKDIMGFLEDHPAIKEAVLELAKIAVVAAPLLIGLGLLSKTVGKLVKIAGGGLDLAKGAAKGTASAAGGAARGARGTYRYGRQVASGTRSAARGDGFLSGYDSQRDRYARRDTDRARGRQRYANASRENGVFRTANQYRRYGIARTTGYDGAGDWMNRRAGRARALQNNARAQWTPRGHGDQAELGRLRGERREIRQNYRQERRDTRSTAAARLRPTDSVDRDNAANSGARQARTELRELQDRLAALRDELGNLGRQTPRQVINALGSSSGESVSAAAKDAKDHVVKIRSEGMEPLNRSKLTQVDQEITSAREKAEKLVSELRSAQREVTQLDVKKLTALKVEVDGAHGTVGDLKDKVDNTALSVGKLDGRKLGHLQAEFKSVTSAADGTYKKVGAEKGSGGLTGRVENLNGRKLTSVKTQFDRLTAAADGTYKKVGQGTGGTNLAGRVGLLNGRSLSSIIKQFDRLKSAADAAGRAVGTAANGGVAEKVSKLNNQSESKVTEQVNKLKTALKNADDKADDLNDSLDDIAKHKTSGGSSKSKKPKKPYSGGIITNAGNLARYATGGVLPGYQPGVDSIPAILSPGEAILRPEVTATLGPDLIHTWNAMARKGQLSRYASGGIAGRVGIDKILDLLHNQNVWPDATAAINTMGFLKTSDPLGGDVQDGMKGAGKRSGNYVGEDMGGKFKGLFDFVTEDSWTFLKRLPTVVGQVIGIIGGTFAPTLGEYFWNDVWKGNGNIVDRGNAFLGDVFSTNTLTSAFDDLFGGLWDSAKALVGGAKDLVTNPVDSVKDTIDALWQVGTGEINQLVDMTKAVKSFAESPMDYAMDVLSDVYETGKEALPNTEGLFDFSDKDKITATKPDSAIAAKYNSTDPPGEGVKRWKPTVQRVLKELGLSQSYTDLVLHRIQVESGGNPKAINNWDSNAKAGYPSQGLMQTIPQTFAAYAGPYRKLGITNGLASIYAGLNYAMHRYGSRWPQALSGNQGYWMGTNSASPGLRLVGENGPELIDFRGGEKVYNDRRTKDLLSGQEKKYEIHIHEAKSEDTTSAVIRAMQYAEAMYGR